MPCARLVTAPSTATSTSVTPRNSAAKPGPSGRISIGEPPSLMSLKLLPNRPAGNRAHRLKGE